MKVTVGKRITTYWNVLVAYFAFRIKYALEYRTNFALQLFYGPTYVLVLFTILSTAYSHTETLAGWTKPEALILFCVFHLLYTVGAMFFMDGIRNLLWRDVRTGAIDFLLTKPLNFQFLVSFREPSLNQILLLIGILLLFSYQILLYPYIISTNIFDLLAFVLSCILGILIFYFALSTYATGAFFFSKAQQIIELFDKLSDFSQYPLPLFPGSLQMLLVTIVPVAFFSYVPSLFILGKGSLLWLAASVIFLIILININQLAWKYALRHYSSASS